MLVKRTNWGGQAIFCRGYWILAGIQAPISTTQGLELGKIFLIEGKSNPLRNNDLDENMKTAFSRKLTVNI